MKLEADIQNEPKSARVDTKKTAENEFMAKSSDMRGKKQGSSFRGKQVASTRTLELYDNILTCAFVFKILDSKSAKYWFISSFSGFTVKQEIKVISS